MQAGNSNFSPITLFQTGFQDYFGRGTGISTLSTENTGLWPPDTHQTGMEAFLIEIFAVRWRTKAHYLLASTEKASFGLSEKDQMGKKQQPRLSAQLTGISLPSAATWPRGVIWVCAEGTRQSLVLVSTLLPESGNMQSNFIWNWGNNLLRHESSPEPFGAFRNSFSTCLLL